jgi:hypothetical protein
MQCKLLGFHNGVVEVSTLLECGTTSPPRRIGTSAIEIFQLREFKHNAVPFPSYSLCHINP